MTPYTISKIIREEKIEIDLQLIVARNQGFITGVEALARGIHPETGENLTPGKMFRRAREEQLSVDLDLLCVEKAFRAFKPTYEFNNETLLFINLNHDCIPYCNSSGFLSACAAMCHLPTENIVVDLGDFSLSDYDMILKFISIHRQKGFYICIDDVGKDYSNIDKIILINPDMIKINQPMLEKLHYDNYRNNLYKYAVSIAHDMGVVVIASDIENKAMLENAFNNGAQYAQGYYISRPHEANGGRIPTDIKALIPQDGLDLFLTSKKVETNRHIMTKIIQFIRSMVERSKEWQLENIVCQMIETYKDYSFVESSWLVDMEGIQMSEAYVNPQVLGMRSSTIFHVYKSGRSYQEKDVYRQLVDTVLDTWITKPYVSLLSNQNIVGTSTFIKLEGEVECILCMNINYSKFQQYTSITT